MRLRDWRSRRIIRYLADAEHARVCLLHIFVTRDLGENGRFEFAHDSLRPNRPGEESGEEAGERDQQELEDRCFSDGERTKRSPAICEPCSRPILLI